MNLILSQATTLKKFNYLFEEEDEQSTTSTIASKTITLPPTNDTFHQINQNILDRFEKKPENDSENIYVEDVNQAYDKNTKFYAVSVGRTTGIYTEWTKVKKRLMDIQATASKVSRILNRPDERSKRTCNPS